MLFSKIFRKEKKQEVKINQTEEKRIGKRYAMQYGRISTPISSKEEHPYSSAILVCNYHELSAEPIAKLWTVVEYLGNGQYLDLITQEVYRKQTPDEDILDTVTQSYERKALEQESSLLHQPLAIGSYSYYQNGLVMQDLTPELKQKIIEESLPRKEEIISVVETMKEEAKKKIVLFYKQKNERKINQYQLAAERENEEIDRKRREEEYLQELARIEQEKLAREEALRKQVDPEFDRLFPTDSANKILTKRKK